MPLLEQPKHVGFTARMLELTSTETPWHRRLWRASTVELANELLNESVRPGARRNAIDDQRKYLMHSLQTDAGIVDHGKNISKELGRFAPGITVDSHDWIVVEQHVERIKSSYLLNWASVFEALPGHRGARDLDGAVRRITAHILSSGMHKNSLFSWLRAIEQNSTAVSIPEFLRQAHGRLQRPERSYTFCVLIESGIDYTRRTPAGWMNPTETAEWLRNNLDSVPPTRQHGSFLLFTEARDVNTAADRVRAQLEVLSAKFRLGATMPIKISPQMWSQDRKSEFPTTATNRLVKVKSFEKLERLYDLNQPEYLSNVLGLAQPLRSGAPHLAIISGWSVIESMLVGPSDDYDGIGADRFALIVAASMLRAEFTRLAVKYGETHRDGLSAQIKACGDNIERAKLFQMRLAGGPIPDMGSAVEDLAVSRVMNAITDPQSEIRKISSILAREFTRLYRKRNITVHGGQISGTNLHSVSELLSPLLGAGIDRIVSVGLRFDVPPIQLSAVAEARVQYLSPASTADPGNLLDILEFSQ